jgi:hypothetical protein
MLSPFHFASLLTRRVGDASRSLGSDGVAFFFSPGAKWADALQEYER